MLGRWPNRGPGAIISRVQHHRRTDADRPAPLDDAELPPGADNSANVGAFRFWFVGQRWEWSDEVARMHGYEPGSVVPTTELVLAHEHPDDRPHLQELLDHALHSKGSFSSRHRFVDTAGGIHDAIVLADRMSEETGAVVGTEGYYIDLTDTFDEARQAFLDEALPDLLEARAVIEQAKGVLMVVYQVNAEQAFGLLRWRSQQTNTKLRALARQLVAEVPTLPAAPADRQSVFDHLLLTLHERVPADSDTQVGGPG